jgi:SAM-dependent methyltransferase
MSAMTSSASPHPNSSAWWNQHYAQGATPWDSGIVPPELHVLLDSGQLQPPGITLDLGCGTGTNVIYLAQRGFTAYGVDLASLALARARAKALAVSAPANFCQGDVADLGFLAVQAIFALDMGCLHALSAADRARYAASLARCMRPDGLYMLYGFDANPAAEGAASGFAPGEVAARFASWFDLQWRRPSRQGDRPVAWYLLRRSSSSPLQGADK